MAESEWKDQVIETGVDKLMEYLRKEREVRVDEAAQSLEVDADTVITWAKSLQESGLAELQYTARRGRIIRIVADEKKPEQVMEDMQEDMAEEIEQLADLGREQARIDRFQDILSRLEDYLANDEEFIEELVAERDDIAADLDEIRSLVDDLDMVEEDVETLERHLDTLKRDIEAVTKLDQLKQQTVQADEHDTSVDEDEQNMSPLYPVKKLVSLVPSIRGRMRNEIACPVCEKTFDTQEGLTTHKRVTGHYQDREEPGQSDQTGNTGEPVEDTFTCTECGSTFDSLHGVRTHMGMKHNAKYRESENSAGTVESGGEQAVHTDDVAVDTVDAAGEADAGETFKCAECNKTFDSRHRHRVHTNQQHDDASVQHEEGDDV